jgi:hypothetical protein
VKIFLKILKQIGKSGTVCNTTTEKSPLLLITDMAISSGPRVLFYYANLIILFIIRRIQKPMSMLVYSYQNTHNFG